MNDLYIYLNVIIITALVCAIYGVCYVSKIVLNQRDIETEILKTFKDAVDKCN